MPTPDLHQRLQDTLAEAADQVGLSTAGAVLLSLHSNAIFHLPHEGITVRIATNPAALPRLTAAVQLTGWLATGGFPCTPPVEHIKQPIVVNDLVVSFWYFQPGVADPSPAIVDLAVLLRDLHNRSCPPVLPPSLDDPLASVADAVAAAPADLLKPYRAWLGNRITELRRRWQTTAFARPATLIHGDAHANNLLRLPDDRVILGDWDHAAVGPREWDLMQIHYTHRRFARPTAADLDAFATAYGWDIRTWPEFETLIAVRELTGLAPYIRTASVKPAAAQELHHRLTTLYTGQVNAAWHPPRRR